LKEAKYVILGAGLAGMSTAYHLGSDYLLFERSDRAGGLCYSENTDGFVLDYCVHVLYHKDPDIRALCDDLLQSNSKDHIRSTWIYSKGVYTQYPFQANLYGLPLNVVEECVSTFIDAKFPRIKSRRASNFAEWNEFTFGTGIAKHFMTPFNEKLWTVHPRKMSIEWVESVVPQPDVEDILDGALPGKKRLFGYNATFRYPKQNGIRSIADGLLERLDGVYFCHEAVGIDPVKKLVRFKGLDELVHYGKLISTLPLKYMPLMISSLPGTVKSSCNKLMHNSVECVNVAVDRPIEMNRHWIYYPEPGFPFYRIMLPHTMSQSMVPKGKGAFSVEVSHGNDRKISLDNLTEIVIDGLRDAKLMEPGEEPLFVNTLSLPCAYSIYTPDRPKAIETIKSYLEENDIYSTGRYGNWEYSNMEKALKDGKELAAKLSGAKVK
jgi:protoporphyrinogen oxidase